MHCFTGKTELYFRRPQYAFGRMGIEGCRYYFVEKKISLNGEFGFTQKTQSTKKACLMCKPWYFVSFV